MDDRDSLVVMPTGGGKSLCFQAPAMCRDGLAVVVSPLLALMKDQVDALTTCGIPAAAVNSTLSIDEKRRIAQQVESGQLRMLYMSPERLVSPRTLEFLQNQHISYFAIDEAHCISAGVMTSVLSIATCGCCATVFPIRRSMPTRRPLPKLFATTLPFSWGFARPRCSWATSAGPICSITSHIGSVGSARFVA